LEYNKEIQKKVIWLQESKIQLPKLPENIQPSEILPLYVELNMDDFKMTKTVTTKPTSSNLIFKEIPFDEQEKMKNIFLIGM
jgi:hypothetical protein